MKSTIHACLIGTLCILPSLRGEINTLTPVEKAEGWKLVFNGKDLENFRIFGSGAAPRKGWVIENGILKKLDGVRGGQIITKEKYADYTLVWEWNINSNANSGIKIPRRRISPRNARPRIPNDRRSSLSRWQKRSRPNNSCPLRHFTCL